jgi:hypothetical protein
VSASVAATRRAQAQAASSLSKSLIASIVAGPMPPPVATYSVSVRMRSTAARLMASIGASNTTSRAIAPWLPGNPNRVLRPFGLKPR